MKHYVALKKQWTQPTKGLRDGYSDLENYSDMEARCKYRKIRIWVNSFTLPINKISVADTYS